MKPLIELIQNLRREEVVGEFREFANDISGWVQGHYDRISGKEHEELAERFVEWFGKEVQDAALREWIGNFGSNSLLVLTDQVARFLRDFDIELAWLVEGRLADHPELAEAAKQVVLHYCTACRIAIGQHDAVRRFQRLEERARMQKGAGG